MVLTNNKDFLPLDSDSVIESANFYKNEQAHTFQRQNASFNLLGGATSNNNNNYTMQHNGFRSSNGYYGFVQQQQEQQLPQAPPMQMQQIVAPEEMMCVDGEQVMVEKRKRFTESWPEMQMKRQCVRPEELQPVLQGAPPSSSFATQTSANATQPAKSFLAHRDHSNRCMLSHYI